MKFEYKYTAPTEEERKEIASIRKQYTEKEKGESKLDRLRRLDRRVNDRAIAVSLSVGIVACLVFGLGLSMVLVWGLIWAAIPVAFVGVLGMLFAYPLHQKTLAYGKKRYGEEIIRLSEELLSGQE